MLTDRPDEPDRRAALRHVLGVGAATVALLRVSKPLYADDGVGPAAEAASVGVQKEQDDLVYIPGRDIQAVTIAEWVDPKAPTGPFRIAVSKQELERAPKDACHYETKIFNYPSGTIRLLTFRKGQPLLHTVTSETEMLVLSGSATLHPLPGLAGKPITLKAGDAIFMPRGNLSAPELNEDLVLLAYLVSTTSKNAKNSVVTAREAQQSITMDWEEDGKEMRATTPEEQKSAPKDAHYLDMKRYQFDGNSIRVATFKGGKSRNSKNTRVDVLVYIVKGRCVRKEGDQILELVAGDTVREKFGNVGYWLTHEETVSISTDAP